MERGLLGWERIEERVGRSAGTTNAGPLSKIHLFHFQEGAERSSRCLVCIIVLKYETTGKETRNVSGVLF